MLVSAHAPHSHSKESVTVWMNAFVGTLRKHVQPGFQVVVGIDANTQLSSEITAATGGHGGTVSSSHA
eukprot:3532412-Karenia_brevis.AAC.1